MSLLLLLQVLLSPALAADLHVTTTNAVDIQVDGRAAVKTFGAQQVILLDVAQGRRALSSMQGTAQYSVEVDVPASGTAWVSIGDKGPVPSEAAWNDDEELITVTFRPDGSDFAIVLDGQRLATVGAAQPVRFYGLTVGAHTVELRSADLSLIWARGTLNLQPDDHIELTVRSGRLPTATGRAGAWQDGETQARRQGAPAAAATPTTTGSPPPVTAPASTAPRAPGK
jgi:hypothetical protein